MSYFAMTFMRFSSVLHLAGYFRIVVLLALFSQEPCLVCFVFQNTCACGSRKDCYCSCFKEYLTDTNTDTSVVVYMGAFFSFHI
jgi:hypothetical protein